MFAPLKNAPGTLALGIAAILFSSVAAQAGFRDISAAADFNADGKAAFADYDGDGRIDLYAGGKLYRNAGGARFTAVAKSGLPRGAGVWGDYNNDGRPDLFNYTRGELYRNEDGKRFRKVPFPALPAKTSRAAIWIDIDNDARLDLYIGGYEKFKKQVFADHIYRNTGNGKFVRHWSSKPEASRSTRGVTAADYNADGHIDLYLSHYRLQPNALLRNDGRGNFTDVAEASWVAGKLKRKISYVGKQYRQAGHTIGSAFGDFNNDGRLDIFVANFSHRPEYQDRPQVLENTGPQAQFRFDDRSYLTNLRWQESYASAALADYDNDGNLDFFLSTVYEKSTDGDSNHSVLYRNSGAWKFEEAGSREKLPLLGPSYQAAWADIDNDGDLDLVANGRMLLNEGNRGNWIGLALYGDASTVNWSALGAVARITLGKKQLTRHVDAATGEGNQNDNRLHFGLGNHSAPVDVEITWPGGHKSIHTGLAPGRYHTLQFKR
jgi:hypothetical protein